MEAVSADFDRSSEAVRDYMERPPNWLIRWGTVSVCAVVFLVFLLSCLIRYPTIVPADFRLISDDLPKAIVPKVDGRIEVLFATESQKVKEGEVVGIMENASDYREILRLCRELDHIDEVIKRKGFPGVTTIKMGHFVRLGDVQEVYQRFQQELVGLRALHTGGFYLKKRQLILDDILQSEKVDEQLNAQYRIYAKDVELAEKELSINRTLHAEHVIADLEMFRQESRSLSRILPLKSIETARSDIVTQKNARRNELMELDRLVFEREECLVYSLNFLRNAISAWKWRYLLAAPVTGIIYFPALVQEKQTVKAGVELMYVETQEKKRYMGEIRVPQVNSGRVGVGHRVLVKFRGFPFEEFGVVEGKVESIAKVPSEDSRYFLATVSLPNGLLTNFNKPLLYKTGMTASAEIITEELRLIERFFYQIRKIVKRY